MEIFGQKVPDADLEKKSPSERTVVIKGDKMTITKGGKDDTVTIRVDPSKSPGHIDTIESKPNGKSETMYVIYKMDGDSLTLCMGVGDKLGESKPDDRPKDFASNKNTMIMTLKKK